MLSLTLCRPTDSIQYGSANQQWNLNGDSTISNMQSGLCLDVDHNGARWTRS